MSLDQLRSMGLLRDEAHWGEGHQASGVSVGALLAAVVVCALGCLGIALGDGGRVTWIGTLVFMLGLFAFLGVNLRGVGRRRRRSAPTSERSETPGSH